MDPKEKEPDEVVQDNKNDIKDINLPLKLNSASNMSIKNEEIETELIDVPPLVKPLEASAPILTEVKPIKPQQTLLYPIVQQNIEISLEKLKTVTKLDYPRLNWNETNRVNNISNLRDINERLSPESYLKNIQINEELDLFYERDQVNKELVVYYKCKLIEFDNFNKVINDFILKHSSLSEFRYESDAGKHRTHEFYELVRD